VHPSTNAPRLVPSLQVPGAFPEDPDEAGGVTTEEDIVRAQLEDLDNMELVFAAETADADVPDPHMLVEATRSPDWPPREEPIKEKPDTCKVHTVAENLNQTGGVDTYAIRDAKVAHIAANPGHVHWGVIKRIFCYFSGTPDPSFMPAETSSPLEGHTDANGHKVEDWYATLGCMFPIDDSTASQPLKWQNVHSSHRRYSQYRGYNATPYSTMVLIQHCICDMWFHTCTR